MVGGFATFAGLTFNKPGTYTLIATSTAGPTVTSAPFTIAQQTVFTWTGAGSGSWSDPKDWQGGLAPAPGVRGTTLYFPAKTLQAVNTDDIPNLVVQTLQIQGNDVIGGSATLTLAGNLVFVAPTGAAIIQCPISDPIVVSAFVGQSNVLAIKNTIAGAGQVVMYGPGVLDLAGQDFYTGGTILGAGTLEVDNNLSVGTGPMTLNGGTLFLTQFVRLTTSTVTVAGVVAARVGEECTRATSSWAAP